MMRALVAFYVLAGAVVAVLASDYTSRAPEPATTPPDASYEQRIAMVCEGVFVATEQGGCDSVEIICRYSDGSLVSAPVSCPAH